MRHSYPPAIVSQVGFGDIVVDYGKVEVTRNGIPVALTAHDFITMQFFVEHPDRVITGVELLKEVCGYEDGHTSSRSIANHIMKLRHNLENDPSCPTHFKTVPRLVYKFRF
ncbi:MAG: winged helix-turn-helix domain-containing protein [Candidatus Sulfotelmatobacter sp.]